MPSKTIWLTEIVYGGADIIEMSRIEVEYGEAHPTALREHTVMGQAP